MTKQDQKILISLKKAESSVNKVRNMVEDGHYCINVMQQTLAAIGLLKSANNQLMKRHLNTCFNSALKGSNKNKIQTMIDEIEHINKLANK